MDIQTAKIWHFFIGAGAEKLEYRCTTRNLLLHKGTKIVSKITLLNSDSINTSYSVPSM